VPAAAATITGLSLYLDPSSWPLHVGLALCNARQASLFPIAVLTAAALVLISGDCNAQIQNYLNILTLADHSENIGVYWYLSVEIFPEHVNFFIYAFQIY